jgi:UDP-N-acetylglucosamine--N-acetylmuramyl-(pentapeptide) pyrophosphoryl-undecaprenol N-acetylglucosamine transferase
MRVLISGGGTGGHVYPALAVVAALPKDSPVLYVGSKGGMEQDLLRRSGAPIPFAAISAAALRGRAPWTMLRNLVILARGIREALCLLSDFGPEAVLVTGGYVSIPVGLAAWWSRIPLLLYLPDIVPGLAVRFLARFATRVATTTADSAKYLPHGKMVVTGYPVRSALLRGDRTAAREVFGFSDEERVLLVAGGSRGSRNINRAIGSAMGTLLKTLSIIHICGYEEDERWLRQQLSLLEPELQAGYRLYRYLHEMPLAFLAADITVCRAGASVLGELPAVGLPAVLVPYPYVNQEDNADYLVRHGAAVKVQDSSLCGTDGEPKADALLEEIEFIVENPDRYTRMTDAMHGLARPDAAAVFVQQLQLLAAKGEVERC